MTMPRNTVLSRLALLLLLAEVLLVLLSWLLSAMMLDGVHSLLASEGIRWFLAHWVSSVCSPPLAWLMLVGMSAGCVRQSRILVRRPAVYRRSLGLRFALFILLSMLCVVLLLTALPHAVLRSATGSLWGAPFSRALMPIICLAAVLCSLGYGIVVRTFTSFQDLFDAFSRGLGAVAPWMVIYILFMQLYESFHYVFMQNP